MSEEGEAIEVDFFGKETHVVPGIAGKTVSRAREIINCTPGLPKVLWDADFFADNVKRGNGTVLERGKPVSVVHHMRRR